MELFYLPTVPMGPMIYDLKRSQGISLTTLIVMGFEKGYDPSQSFEHTKFTVPDGSFDEYRETLFKLGSMQTAIAHALARPVKVEFQIASEQEARDLNRERESALVLED